MSKSTVIALSFLGIVVFYFVATYLEKKLTKYSFTWKKGPNSTDGK